MNRSEYNKKYFKRNRSQWATYRGRTKARRRTKESKNAPRIYKGLQLFTTRRLLWQLGYTKQGKNRSLNQFKAYRFSDKCRMGNLWIWGEVIEHIRLYWHDKFFEKRKADVLQTKKAHRWQHITPSVPNGRFVGGQQVRIVNNDVIRY